MKIVMYSYNDWGGANNLLASYINKHTKHQARSITEDKHPFCYDTDIVWKNIKLDNAENATDTIETAVDVANIIEDANFFVLGQLYDTPLLKAIQRRLKPNNHIIFYGGSDVRPHADKLFNSYRQKEHRYTFTRDDFTMIRCLSRSNHHNVYMVDTNRFKPIEKNIPHVGPVKIFHSPTNQAIKGTIHIKEAVENLSKKYDIYWEHTGTTPSGAGGITWAEGMAKKASADIYIDQLYIGAIGANVAETMTFGIPVLCYLSNHFMSMYPDTPIVNVNPDTIEATLEDLIVDHEKRRIIGNQTRNYCVDLYGVHNSAWRWIHMIEFVAGDKS